MKISFIEYCIDVEKCYYYNIFPACLVILVGKSSKIIEPRFVSFSIFLRRYLQGDQDKNSCLLPPKEVISSKNILDYVSYHLYKCKIAFWCTFWSKNELKTMNNGWRDRGYFLFSDHAWRFDVSQHIRFYPGLIRLPKIPISEASLLHFGSPDDQLFSRLLHFLTNFSENLPQNGKKAKKTKFASAKLMNIRNIRIGLDLTTTTNFKPTRYQRSKI